MGCKNSPAKTKRHITENSDGYVPFCGFGFIYKLNYIISPSRNCKTVCTNIAESVSLRAWILLLQSSIKPSVAGCNEKMLSDFVTKAVIFVIFNTVVFAPKWVKSF